MDSAVNWVVMAPDYTPFSGGCIALHKLCHHLVELGERGFLLSGRIHPDFCGRQIDMSQYRALDKRNTVVIYPEITSGNPLRARHVVRWLLNTPGFFGGDGIYAKTDFVFKYSDYFESLHDRRVDGLLSAYHVDREMFRDHGYAREGVCYMVRKGKHHSPVHHPEDALRLDDVFLKGGPEYLAEVFNRRKMFISYDAATFISVQAALCGCVSVVIPDGKTSREEWLAKVPCMGCGVAYGFDDIERASASPEQVAAHLESMQERSIGETRFFVQHVAGKLREREAVSWSGRLVRLKRVLK